MAYGPAETQGATTERALPCPEMAPVFDQMEFDELSEMIGADGVLEMVDIFGKEMRLRLERLRAGDQDLPTLTREMHTIKGAAGTVAAARLSELGQSLEHAAHEGLVPTPNDVGTIAAELDEYLAAIVDWRARHAL